MCDIFIWYSAFRERVLIRCKVEAAGLTQWNTFTILIQERKDKHERILPFLVAVKDAQ